MSQSQQQTQIVNITTLSPEDLARLIKILIAEFGYSQQGTERINDDKYYQSQSANEILSKQILENSVSGMRSTYTIEYFPKDIDHSPEIVCKTLGNLGFNVHLEEAMVQDVPTNAIWFGSQVSVDDVKLVAYTLIRAGLDIKTIKPFRHRADGDDKSKLIQIGADADCSESPSLSVSFIRDQDGFYRND